MIRKVEVENFMSLRDVSVELDPLTIFVGKNSSGKSALFKSLVFLSRLLNGVPLRGQRGELLFEPGVTLDELVFGGDGALPIKFRVWLESADGPPNYELEIKQSREGWSVVRESLRSGDYTVTINDGHPFHIPAERNSPDLIVPLRATLSYLVQPYLNDSKARPVIDPILQSSKNFGQVWRYRPSAIDIARFVDRPTKPGARTYVQENGYGLAAKLQDLHNDPTDREKFVAIETDLKTLFPHIQNLGFENGYQGVRLSYRTNRSTSPIPAPQESDGVLLTTFLLWRLKTHDKSLAVCLEEPENGLHPLLLADRFGLLRKASVEGNQILVSTHSPEFCRVLKAHPQSPLFRSIRVVELSEHGTTVIRTPEWRELPKLLDSWHEEMQNNWTPVIEQWAK